MMKAQDLPKVYLSKNLRCALVGLQYILLPISTTLMLSTPAKSWDWIMLVVFVVVMAASMFVHTTLALSIGNICQGRLDRLDERERTMRDATFVTAFEIVKAVLSVAWIYGVLAFFLGWWLPQGQQIWILLWMFAMMAYGLPTSVAAFTMPETPRDSI
ncbi:MAG: hypothetical protein SFU83_10905 [Meiothermus sp.]|nr:hypothetical protein [Meiothermus sp.]